MNDAPAWPNRWPYFRFLGIVLSCAALFWFARLWQKHAPLVQRYDLAAYVRTALPPIPFWKSYTVLLHGENLATPDDDGALTPVTDQYDHDRLHSSLREQVYDGKGLAGLLMWPLVGFGLALTILTSLGSLADRHINRGARDGRLIRGPRLVSHWRWNWGIKKKVRGFFVETR